MLANRRWKATFSALVPNTRVTLPSRVPFCTLHQWSVLGLATMCHSGSGASSCFHCFSSSSGARDAALTFARRFSGLELFADDLVSLLSSGLTLALGEFREGGEGERLIALARASNESLCLLSVVLMSPPPSRSINARLSLLAADISVADVSAAQVFTTTSCAFKLFLIIYTFSISENCRYCRPPPNPNPHSHSTY